jgi:hypothetical protein
MGASRALAPCHRDPGSGNAEFFTDLGSPGGASAVGKIRKDHPIVAGLPPQR